MVTIFSKIEKQITENPILLYMKGSPNIPKCIFSFRAVQILLKFEKNFFYVDVLENLDIKKKLPEYSNWPTFPQLWINKKLIGGYDIMKEIYESGELKKMIENTKKNRKI